jgi:hypothetical protein
VNVVPAATLDDYLRECLVEKQTLNLPIQTFKHRKT